MKLHVDDGGPQGALVPVVLHHGLGADLEVWRPQLTHLRKTRRAVALDMRGHGRSPKAERYTIEDLAADLDEVVERAGVEKFWLVGHSLSGLVVSAYAGAHPEKLAGVVYVDAVGDVSGAPPEMIELYLKRDEGITPERLQEEFAGMLGPLAREGTKRHILDSAARMDLPAFALLRAEMPKIKAAKLLARFKGPKFAIEAEGEVNPAAASHLPDVKRRTIANVSHWLMLDDPDALNRALDEVLAWTG
jgi:pimeloyl-ACP methyl ester carboxylesterase